MLLLTLVLAALGFAMLVAALTTGSVVWAWGCIVACVLGAMVLLGGALTKRSPGNGDSPADEGRRPSGAAHRRK